jgi:hypothetical protein
MGFPVFRKKTSISFPENLLTFISLPDNIHTSQAIETCDTNPNGD